MRKLVPTLVNAVLKGLTDDVIALIADGADVNEPSKIHGGLTALHAACGNSQIEIVAKLLAANADVNLGDNYGATPLFTACSKGHAEVVTTLTAANASMEQANVDGLRPLHVAVVRSRTMPATSRVQTDCRQRSRAARARAVGVSLPRAEAEA